MSTGLADHIFEQLEKDYNSSSIEFCIRPVNKDEISESGAVLKSPRKTEPLDDYWLQTMVETTQGTSPRDSSIETIMHQFDVDMHHSQYTTSFSMDLYYQKEPEDAEFFQGGGVLKLEGYSNKFCVRTRRHSDGIIRDRYSFVGRLEGRDIVFDVTLDYKSLDDLTNIDSAKITIRNPTYEEIT